MRRLAEHVEMADDKDETEVEKDAPEQAKGETEGEKGETGDESEGKKPKLRLSHKKLAILAVPLVLMLGAGGYFAKDFVMGMLPTSSEEKVGPKIYYNLPEMVVNLSSRDKRSQYLKLKVSLEAPNQMVLKALNPIMPRVLDMFQLYLRELRSSDLEGSAGIYRLKEELLRRINLELHPHKITRVLFNEIIVQ
jgi:flagellar FliL protein